MKHFILHMDLDSFFVSVERLKNPDLVDKAVIIGGNNQRGVVSSCSYEARAFGVHSAMPTYRASQLCPDAHFVQSSFSDYGLYSKLVTQIIEQRVPIFEKASIDEFYIDLTGMDKYFGCYEFAKTLRLEIMEKTGLPISFGLAANKTLAKMATNIAKPNGHKFVLHGSELDFLDPQPIKNIPGLGKQSASRLQIKGIETIADLRKAGKENLENWFGKYGTKLYQKSMGLGSTTIVRERERKSISKEHTFFEPIRDKEVLQSVLHQMVEELSHRLRLESLFATSLSIKLRYPNFETFSKQQVVHATNFEHELIPELNQLFNRMYNNESIRLIGIRLAGFTYAGYQASLFDNVDKLNNIYQCLDHLKTRYGKQSIQRGSSLNKSE